MSLAAAVASGLASRTMKSELDRRKRAVRGGVSEFFIFLLLDSNFTALLAILETDRAPSTGGGGGGGSSRFKYKAQW